MTYIPEDLAIRLSQEAGPCFCPEEIYDFSLQCQNCEEFWLKVQEALGDEA